MDQTYGRRALDLIYAGMPQDPGNSVDVGHFFGAGIYVRKSVVPKGSSVRMHIHEYDHLSVLASGQGRLITDEGQKEISSGAVIETKAFVRHAYFADEETIWLCIHPMEVEDAKKIYGGLNETT